MTFEDSQSGHTTDDERRAAVPASDPIPDGKALIEAYRRTWETVGEAWFTVETLAEGAATDASEGHRLADRTLLGRLVAVGLLRWDGDEHYQIRCPPDGTAASWRDAFATRTDALSEAVQDSADGDTEPDESHGPATVETGDERYVEVHVDGGSTDFADALGSVERALDTDAGVAGVVLVAPGTEATTVQTLADRLCDDTRVHRHDCRYRFEKETSSVLGGDADELTFRLFLGATRHG